ncbi:MAG: YscO family type III secretion system apparatus protein [Pseudomonadota bacterium]
MDERLRQFTVLTKVKGLREEKALDGLQAARRALTTAEERHATLQREVSESAASLPKRIAAVYGAIIGTIVDQEALSSVREEASALERAHLLLVDRCDRAAHVVETRRQALTAAASAHRLAQRNREKFAGLLTDMANAAETEAEARQEIEVEDLFTAPRSPLTVAS